MLGAFTISNTFAEGESIYKGNECNYLLGLVNWDCGVDVKDQDSLKGGFWTVAANVASDITVVAAYLVLGYVIYGGYLYIFSTAEPAKLTIAKKTLSNAFIGLAIVLSANVIMSTIRITLIASGEFQDCTRESCVDPGVMVQQTINWFIAVAGIVSAIFLVYGGISYMTSSGEPNKLQKAKNTITYSLIGLAIVALATIITAFVSNMIKEANGNAGLINETIISKEVYEIKIT